MFLLGHLFGFVSAYAAEGQECSEVLFSCPSQAMQWKASVQRGVCVCVLRRGDLGDPSLPSAVTSLTESVAEGGTQGETLHYCCSAGVASVSLPREGLVLGNREAKRGKEHYRQF